MNGWVWIIGIPLLAFLAILHFRKGKKYKKGSKIANTTIVEETDLYKSLKIQYTVFTSLAVVCLLAGIALSFVLLSRPVHIETVKPEIHNRDIMLCLDISSSVDQLNLDICNKLEDVVKELDGERFGITIFNGKAVQLVPLTSDYDHVLNMLDKLKASIEEGLAYEQMSDSILGSLAAFESVDWETYYYKYNGTFIDGGSSYIGDGLASALYSFPDLKTNDERSRIIIFTTDNELNGVSYVTVDEATDLCLKNKVKVFAITPERVVDEGNFMNAILKTQGGYYKAGDHGAFDRLVADIRDVEASQDVLTDFKVQITDKPSGWFVFLVILVGFYFVICKKVRL